MEKIVLNEETIKLKIVCWSSNDKDSKINNNNFHEISTLVATAVGTERHQ